MIRPARAAGARSRIALVATLACVASVATACSACGKSPGRADRTWPPATSSAPVVSRTSFPPEAGAAAVRDVAMWTSARDGQPEDLASLATHEGAAGLVEAAAEPELRSDGAPRDGLRARLGAAALPRADGVGARRRGGAARARLGGRARRASRTAEDVEDAAELREGCEKLGALARDAARPRERRVLALRALRMMPCPKQELPADLDAR